MQRMKPFFLITVCLGLISINSFSQKIVWKQKKDVPYKVLAASSVVLNNEIYLVSGNIDKKARKEAYKYNPVTDTWHKLADVLTPKWNFTAVAYDNKIFTIGGDPFLGKNEVLNNSTWQTLTPMLAGRQHVGGCEVNGKIYVLGGLESWNKVSDKVEEYDPKTDSWSLTAYMPVPKHNTSIIAFNDEIYVIGGNTVKNGDIWHESFSVEIYNVVTKTWRRGSNLPEPRLQSGIVKYNNEIYLIGGWIKDKGTTAVTSTVLIYNPEMDIWRTTTSTPLPISSVGTAIIGNKIYLMGGFRDNSFISLSENLEGTIID